MFGLKGKKYSNLDGQVFGRLTVKGLSHKDGYNVFWLCLCECGKTKVTSANDLIRSRVKSCGCLLLQGKPRHGETINGKQSKEWTAWRSMRKRCYDKNNIKYKIYGGRGITICERWSVFENFLNDMGRAPSQRHSIDRIDNNGNYEPGNCRWATYKEQNNNRTFHRHV